MSEDSKEREIGFFCNNYDFNVLTWEIPNVSSIPHEVDYFVQSPLFSYSDASWILKLYPYGQTEYQTNGYIDLIIERLHSKKEQSFSFRFYCENIFQKKYNPICAKYAFEPNFTQAKICRFMRNLKECPEKWQFLPNDTFTLVLGFNSHCRPNLENTCIEIESNKKTLGKKYSRSKKNEILETGELIKDSFVLKSFFWKVCLGRQEKPFHFPEDYQVQSPPFDLAGALWILKMYAYFQMKQSRKPNCDIVLERLNSEIPEHHVLMKLRIQGSVSKEASGSFVISPNNTIGDVMSFQWNEGDVSGKSCLHFDTEICMKNVSNELNSTKVVESCAGSMSITKSSVALQKNKVLQNIKKLYLQQEDCDAIINVKGKKFPVHKLILKAQSPVLASAFRTDMKEKATGIINVEDCEPSTFSDFLCFLYCGEVEGLSTINVFSLFTVSDKYDVSDLRSICMEFIKNNLSVDTFCDTVALALLHSETELLKLSTDFFAKNIQEIIVTVKWQSFIVENPIQGNELLIKALVPSQKALKKI